MKKLLSFSAALILMICLVSWGFTGHRTVALIAANHLTPQAKAAVADLLNGQSMADVSTWADEVRNKPEYKHTAGWHFLNLPLGLNVDEFEKQVKSLDKENVYSAFQSNLRVLQNISSTKEQKGEALKFIIHLVGDAHQPMHISRAEDKGGNTIQIQFDGKGTNLHSLWDSKLLDKQGLSDVQMAENLDNATLAQIKKWQSENSLYWIWESYQISSKLYEEVKSGSKLDDAYYQKHIGTMNKRIEQAGTRLAGVLNRAFEGYSTTSSTAKESSLVYENRVIISDNEASKHIGEHLSVYGRITGHKDLGSMTLVNLGGEYPNQTITIALRGEARNKAKTQFLTDKFINSQIKGKAGNAFTATGTLKLFKGKPQIEVSNPEHLNVITIVVTDEIM